MATLDLKQVGEDVYVAGPADMNAAKDTQGPSVIIIFGWMEGKISHIKKYADAYARLFPHASQIIVRSRQNFWFKNKAAKEASLQPVVEHLRKEGMFNNTPPSLLVHVFSNGGAFQLAELSRMSKSSVSHPDNLPPTAIIFDSVPGQMSLDTTLAAFLAPIKSRIIKALLSVPLALVYWIIVYGRLLLRLRPPFDLLREKLNEAEILPWTSKKTPRLYLYSDTDKLVQVNAVEEHVAQARQLGLNVDGELFKGSAHVAHVRVDPQRYWSAIERVWRKASAI